MKILLPVTWNVCGFVEVEDSSIENAIKNFDPENFDLPKVSEYIDSSFELTTGEKDEVEFMSEDETYRREAQEYKTNKRIKD